MNLVEWKKQMLQPIPDGLVRGRLQYVGLGFIILSGLLEILTVRPSIWSPTWWLVLSTFVMGAMILRVDWEKASIGMVIPFSLISVLLASGVVGFNPEHSELVSLFILISVFVGMLYSAVLLALHGALIVLGFVVHVWQGGDSVTTLILGSCTIAVLVFMRSLHAALKKQVSQTQTLENLLELLPVLKARGVQDVVQEAVRQLVKATASDSGIVAVVNHERRTLRPYYLYFKTPIQPEEEQAWLSFESPVGEGLAGWVAQHRQSLITGDALRDPRGTHVPGTVVMDESIMAVPLMAQGNLYGVLRLQREGLNQYAKEDLEFLELMAVHVSDALSRAALEERMARTDPLTGAYNRHFLNEWSEKLKPTGKQISVIMIDCRGFKQINDRWGHLAGDRILQEAARLLKESVRAGDLVVRYGGDEFLVVLSQAGPEEAAAVAGRLKTRVGEWNRTQPPESPLLTLDVGTDTAHESEWLSLLERADARMYASKRAS